MITINNKYAHGEYVYIAHNPEHKRMIIAIEVYMDKSYLYKVAGRGDERSAYEYCQEQELVKEDERVLDFAE